MFFLIFCRNFAFSDIRRQSRKSPATPPQLILHTSRIFRKSPATPPQLKMVENGENRPNSAQKGQMGAHLVFSPFSFTFYTFPPFSSKICIFFAVSPFFDENCRKQPLIEFHPVAHRLCPLGSLHAALWCPVPFARSEAECVEFVQSALTK